MLHVQTIVHPRSTFSFLHYQLHFNEDVQVSGVNLVLTVRLEPADNTNSIKRVLLRLVVST